MIPRRILLTIITILMLLPTFAYSKSDSTNTSNDTVAIEVLEERVKGNAERTQNQVEALQKLLDAQNDALNQRITDLDKASQRQTSIILVMAGFFLTFLTALATYFGRKTMAGWIKQTISGKTDALIEQHKTGLAEQAKKASEEWARVDKARDEYESLKDRLEKKAKELTAIAKKKEPVEPTEKTSEFQQMVEAVKDEGEYTATDWHLLGNEAYSRGDWKAAVTRYSNSIALDPDDHLIYYSRGLAFGKQGLYKEALESYDKTLEIIPDHLISLQNAAEIRILFGNYNDALEQVTKSLDFTELRKDKANSLYLKCIAEKLLNKDTSSTEAKFEKILEEDLAVTWSFDEIEKWLEDEKTDISEEARKFIEVKTAMLKAKKIKQ